MRRLRRALDRAVTIDATLAPARAMLLQPLELLEAFAAEAEGTLADDVSAQERLRLMISMAAGRAIEMKRSLTEEQEVAAAGSNTTIMQPAAAGLAPPCEPGVLDLGALVIVGLAAGRVGRRLGIPGVFVDTVFAIAVSASPAEAIARSLGTGLDEAQVAAVLGGLPGAQGSAARASALVPMFLDVCERARWRCLEHLFATVREQARNTDWEGAIVSPIEYIAPRTSDDPPRIVIKLRKNGGGDRVGEVEIDTAKLLATFKESGKVIFAAPGRAPIAVSPLSTNKSAGTITVEVPSGAHAGWVGLTTPDLVERTREMRELVKVHWNEENVRQACLRDSPVPIDAIPSKSIELLTPPRSTSANWGLRLVDVVVEQNGDEALVLGKDALVTATFSPANTGARVEMLVANKPIAVTLGAGVATGALPASAVKDKQVVAVRLSAAGSTAIDDERSVTMTVAATAPPPPSTNPGTPGAPTPPSTGGGAIDRKVDVLSVVVVRPIFRRSDDTMVRASADAIDQISQYNEIIPLPWIADDDLAFTGQPEDPEGGAVQAIIERLESMATRTAGYEYAGWVAVVPAPRHGRGIRRSVTSEVARAIVVVSEDLIDRAIVARVEDETQPELERLRVVGRRNGDDVVLVEPTRVERRAAGPGAAYLTELNGAASDRSGRDLLVTRIRTTNPARSGLFVALVPVGDEVAALNLRLQPELLAVELRAQPSFVDVDLRGDGESVRSGGITARASVNLARRGSLRGLPSIARPTGAPEFLGEPTATVLPADRVTGARSLRVAWKTRHPNGIRPRIEIELAQTGAIFDESGMHAYTRVLVTEGASGEVIVPADRLGSSDDWQGGWVDRVRVVASDGWNSDAREQYFEPIQSKELLIRRFAPLRYWADAADDDEVRWSVERDDEQHEHVADLGTGRAVVVDLAYVGLVLVARIIEIGEGSEEGEEQLVAIDRVRIPAGDR
ncbi:MAG TPA: hypothetical protein VG755_44510 [Nannocystaceae bacterium]|nr:hypothetical protein [Nannocystaceae bacterium]